MKIVLVRHGKVDHPPIAIISAASFVDWVKAYDSNILDKTSMPAEKVIEMVTTSNAVVCSELVRSHESAKLLNVQVVTYSDSMFNEAGLPIAHWNFPSLSVRLWAILFRLLWLIGYSENSESLRQAGLRATQATEKLIDLALEYGSVAFIGHAIFNRMLANRLRQKGWSGPKITNNKHWGFTEYKK